MNGIIVVDKPGDWTSHDVVAKLRGVLHEKRIGHGGTLDPMATGVLPVFVGRATRAAEYCASGEKEYVAGMTFGVTTDTQDTTGNVLTQTGLSPDLEALRGVLRSFAGTISQIPPMYSAIKIGGKKLYQLARRGVEVERAPRTVEIRELELLETGESCCRIRVVCSKGTYIRTLCSDIGERLGCGAAMCSLVRTRAGTFEKSEAVSLDEVENAVRAGMPEKVLRPVDSLFSGLPEVHLGEEQEKKCRNGNPFALPGADGQCRVYGPAGDFLMLGMRMDGTVRTVKSFFEPAKEDR